MPARRKPRRRYSDDERASALAALAANGGKVKPTAKQLGIAETTLRQWAEGHRHPEAAQMSALKKGPLADRLEEIAWQLADALPGKVETASLQQTATSLAIAIDKMQLLRNKPTTINRDVVDSDADLRGLSDAELDARLAAAAERAREASAADGGEGDGAAGDGAEPPAGGEGPAPAE
ncbi:MAG TPA: transposase [Urbifossiella sp.]|nr:transposase [Urbifossiella sp.]